MGALDLNKVAIAMGKMLKSLPLLEQKGSDYSAIEYNKEEHFAMAYLARVGILDRIDKNPYMNNPSLPITIPLGIFKTRKETMGTALYITVGKLLSLSENNESVNSRVIDILERGDFYYEFENLLPPELINQLRNS